MWFTFCPRMSSSLNSCIGITTPSSRRLKPCCEPPIERAANRCWEAVKSGLVKPGRLIVSRSVLPEEIFLPVQLSGWKQKIVAFAGALGAPGLFLISFLDSSVLTFPVINDLLLIELCIQHPARMPLYPFMAMLGSLLGCV